MRRCAAVLAALALALVACGGDEPASTATPSAEAITAPTVDGSTATPPNAPTATRTEPAAITEPSARLVEAFPGADLPSNVLAMLQVPGSDLLVLVSQGGRIVSFPRGGPYADPATALDIAGELAIDNELGLLSMAFDPAFESNNFVYLYYSVRAPELRTVVVRMTTDVEGERLVIDASNPLTILRVDQPFGNHNGGTLAFGPDGMLYLGLGDGGSGGDPRGNGQGTRGNLLGSIIRIDVRHASAGERYAIPADNPFVGDGGVLNETWAFGVRNPWRMAFDSETGELWAGDVGQDRFEEVDIIRGGQNFGWNITEGSACFEPPAGCDASGLTLPVAEYSRDLGCSIIGGYVYRGEMVPALVGHYIYGDLCTGNVWALDAAKAAAGNPAPPVMLWQDGPGMFSFAVDADQELYLLSTDGAVYQFAP